MTGRRHITPGTRLVGAIGLSIGAHALLLAALSSGAASSGAGSGSAAPGSGGGFELTVIERGPAGAAGEVEDVRSAPDAVGALLPPRDDAPARPATPHVADVGRVALATARPPRAGKPAAAGTAAAPDESGAGAGGDGAAASAAAGGMGGIGAAASGRGAGSGSGSGGEDLRGWCHVCPSPEYPARARRQGWQGTVDVDLRVGRDGVVEQASVGRSSGFAALDAAAVTVARRSRFATSGSDTELRGYLRYRFVLEEALSRHPL